MTPPRPAPTSQISDEFVPARGELGCSRRPIATSPSRPGEMERELLSCWNPLLRRPSWLLVAPLQPEGRSTLLASVTTSVVRTVRLRLTDLLDPLLREIYPAELARHHVELLRLDSRRPFRRAGRPELEIVSPPQAALSSIVAGTRRVQRRRRTVPALRASSRRRPTARGFTHPRWGP